MQKQMAFVLAGMLWVGIAHAEVMVDAKKNASKTGWESFSTRRLEDLVGFRSADVPLTKFGGRADRREKATGFFHVQRVGGRWWFVGPEGGLFINAGVVAISPHSTYGSKDAFSQLFGDKEKWAAATLDLLRASGFNGCGGWSDQEAIRHAIEPLAYTVSLNLAAGFGKRLGISNQQPGHTGYAGDCIPSLHPDFPAYCETACQHLAAYADDPWCIGYFSDNEMPGNLKMLDNMLALDEANPALSPERRAASDWLRARKGGDNAAGSITDADRKAFLGYVYDTYFRITTAAIRRYDPHHLCLGSRLHGPVKEKSEVWAAAGRYLDAIAMNYYGAWTPRASDLANWYKWSGKPCLITEFYVKGADTPYRNATGAGWIVKTQADRGLFYQNFTLGLLESKTCVGWHWFKYMDNDPEDTTVDPSNRDSNKGIVTIRYEPYTAMLDLMKPINRNLYALADYFDRR